MKRIVALLFLLAAAGSLRAQESFEGLLQQLDLRLKQRETYIENREQRIGSLKELLDKSEFTPEQQYLLNERLVNEYVSYQADSAIRYFYRNIDLAGRMKNSARLTDSRIELAHFYASTGIYFEASQTLGLIDTMRLTPSQRVRYYAARHKLNDELQLYSHDAEQSARSLRLALYYNDRVIAESEPGSVVRLNAELWRAMYDHRYGVACALADAVMERVPVLSREYATVAYMRALVAELEGDREQMRIWFARSAITDIQLAIRDYAALKSLASVLTDIDIQRAMKYIRVVMDDAQYFNSRLRPWQDALVLPGIEQAYYAHKLKMDRIQLVFACSMVLFVLLAIGGLYFSLRQNRKLHEARRRMHEANERLNVSVEDLRRINERLKELNNQIVEANGVKEEYIGMFLMMCSEYIDKIAEERRRVRKLLRDGKIDDLRKEYAASSTENVELKQFYNLFDTTFLRLYPTFVEELNSLLAEDSRIEPKKGEYLNTELRIFALIRLGISDTPKIAALLHYSLSTIYNYRSKIRYRSNITRDEFEKRIRTIGSFNAQHP